MVVMVGGRWVGAGGGECWVDGGVGGGGGGGWLLMGGVGGGIDDSGGAVVVVQVSGQRLPTWTVPKSTFS